MEHFFYPADTNCQQSILVRECLCVCVSSFVLSLAILVWGRGSEVLAQELAAYWAPVRHSQWFQQHPILSSPVSWHCASPKGRGIQALLGCETIFVH